jgi:hypothetical protein
MRVVAHLLQVALELLVHGPGRRPVADKSGQRPQNGSGPEQVRAGDHLGRQEFRESFPGGGGHENAGVQKTHLDEALGIAGRAPEQRIGLAEIIGGRVRRQFQVRKPALKLRQTVAAGAVPEVGGHSQADRAVQSSHQGVDAAPGPIVAVSCGQPVGDTSDPFQQMSGNRA